MEQHIWLLYVYSCLFYVQLFIGSVLDIKKRWLMIMWNKRMPRESCVVVIRECSRKGIVKESVAVYDENENVFFKNGKRISKVKEWRYR